MALFECFDDGRLPGIGVASSDGGRVLRELGGPTRVIQIFPNEAVSVPLVSGLAMETNLERMEGPYLKMEEIGTSEEGMVEVA